ncbi:MAG: hypothetical protein IJP13_01110 [Lachnospiraceae bacterium]|nr:hypothetical protein [Lachnospiraceae bacterium]
MSDGFSKIVAILLSVLMMFIIPVFYMQNEADRVKQTRILEEVILFVDGVRNTGIIGKEDYNRLEEVLIALGGTYKIQILHSTHMYDESGKILVYNANQYYESQIKDSFVKDKDYLMSKNDYIRVLIKNREDDIVAWYGGSIKYEAY